MDVFRRWLLRLWKLVAATVLVLLAVEGAFFGRDLVRKEMVTGTTFEGSVFEFSASRHHRLIPNGRFWHTSYEYDYLWSNNSLGMRDRERQRDKPPGTFRVLVLGDSMIQGHGVRLEDAMTTRLEKELNAASHGKPIEVLNAGVFGYGPLLESIYLRELLDLRPDLVVLGFSLENDVGDDWFYAAKAHRESDGATVRFEDHEWPWSAVVQALEHSERAERPVLVSDVLFSPRELLRHSHVARLVKSRLDSRAYPAEREREFALVRTHRGDIQYDLALVNYPVRTHEERLQYWAVSQGYLADIARLCRSAGVPLVLLVIPPAERVTGEVVFDEPYDVLASTGKSLGMPVVNLLPDFLGDDVSALYYKFDRHWTQSGNARAAAVVGRELRRLGMVPTDG